VHRRGLPSAKRSFGPALARQSVRGGASARQQAGSLVRQSTRQLITVDHPEAHGSVHVPTTARRGGTVQGAAVTARRRPPADAGFRRDLAALDQDHATCGMLVSRAALIQRRTPKGADQASAAASRCLTYQRSPNSRGPVGSPRDWTSGSSLVSGGAARSQDWGFVPL
jgi:hypothetical protein